MNDCRRLIITADDFGIGPETSRGILDLAARGAVTATVLLVNSPYAEDAVSAWRRAGAPAALGWHPCLTLDRPVLPACRVPSLVRPDGRFWPLPGFLARLFLGRLLAAEIEAELRAQLRRFGDLVGARPALVATHHHIQIFSPVGAILRELLGWRPYVRRVREPWGVLARVPGARGKRALLAALGRADARRWDRKGFPGNDCLAGVSDARRRGDPDHLARWLACVPGRVVEWVCHPGHGDQTLAGRDPQQLGRADELLLLGHPRVREACRRARFCVSAPAAVRGGG